MHGKNCDEQSLDFAMCGAGYVQIGRTEYELPNKKVFIRLDYKRQNVTIRLAVPADAPDIAEVLIRSWEVAYKDIVPSEYIKERNATRLEQFKKSITDENKNHYVIQKQGKTVGSMWVAQSQDDDMGGDCYEVHSIHLHPAYFRQGIGTQAMGFAFDIARNLGKKTMIVWVIEENTNSIKFYEKCGFEADGKTKDREYGKVLKLIRMKKDL